jgi:hypothetical protein
VRAKRKIRDAGIPYVVPEMQDMPARLDAVLTVIYLVFNEGYAATRGETFVRTDLCSEAIRLGRLVRTLLAPQPPAEATGLVALMLLQDSRRAARVDEAGDLVLLEDQDRRRWDQQQIVEALPLVEEALRDGPDPVALQAAIAAVHCQAARAEDTDWPQILRLYDLLDRVQPSPIVSLNRAVAVAMVDGPQPALALIDALAATGDLDGYHLLHAARADLLRSGEELRTSARAGHHCQRAAVSRAEAARSAVEGSVTCRYEPRLVAKALFWPASSLPRETDFVLLMHAPNGQSRWQHPNHPAHPLGLCLHLAMPQEPADILGYHHFLHIEVDQTVPFMTQATVVEVGIERKKRWSVQLMQQGDYLVVFHPLPSNFLADLADGDSPPAQQASLTLRDVFIEDVHAGRGSCAYSIA